MSKLFVCVGNRAKNPYQLPAEKFRIYTMEELCYYICKGVNTIDKKFMKEELVAFIEIELGMPELSDELSQILRFDGSLSAFCGLILDYAGYLTKQERRKIEVQIRENENLPVLQRLCRQGEEYEKEKQYQKAQKTYLALMQRSDVAKDAALMSRIYYRLGCITAQMFQYETAAYCFLQSTNYAENEEATKRYLICQMFLMSRKEYIEWLSEKPEYQEVSMEAERFLEESEQEMERRRQEMKENMDITCLKEEYYRMVLE